MIISEVSIDLVEDFFNEHDLMIWLDWAEILDEAKEKTTGRMAPR